MRIKSPFEDLAFRRLDGKEFELGRCRVSLDEQFTLTADDPEAAVRIETARGRLPSQAANTLGTLVGTTSGDVDSKVTERLFGVRFHECDPANGVFVVFAISSDGVTSPRSISAQV